MSTPTKPLSIHGCSIQPQDSSSGASGSLTGASMPMGTPDILWGCMGTPLPSEDGKHQEEKIKVLRRHLVSKEEWQRNNKDVQASSSLSTHHPHEGIELNRVYSSHDIYKSQFN
ncbi:hypothetical protein IW261DRAFT_1426663 [Armillaria novae-zelandiae]|uniref:Uncharacterized protein n=1 Tax=Armillaria novae-zelandiae TaxID=153914 RepID=A0AA39NKM3_9AGAR|nr:hypothetical protein IW261DRAFT_1426663 [Armillaria novae-zelandiae]